MLKTKYPIFKSLHRGQKGFTLIELLIVVAILGIIAAVVIPNIAGFMVTGQLSAANSEVENMKTAVLGYFGDHSGDSNPWPDDSSALVPDYLSGAPKAVYDIGTFGWIVDVISSNWTTDITFEPGLDQADGYHGKWKRATAP